MFSVIKVEIWKLCHQFALFVYMVRAIKCKGFKIPTIQTFENDALHTFAWVTYEMLSVSNV